MICVAFACLVDCGCFVWFVCVWMRLLVLFVFCVCLCLSLSVCL